MHVLCEGEVELQRKDSHRNDFCTAILRQDKPGKVPFELVRRGIQEEICTNGPGQRSSRAGRHVLDVATAPFVYRQFSTRRLLTMERLEGVPLVDLDSLRGITPEPEAFALSSHPLFP